MEELNKELEQDWEEENRDTRQLIRELRQDLKLKEEELKGTKEGSVAVQDQIVKEQRQTERHKKAYATWQARYTDLADTQVDNGGRVTALEGELKNKTRGFVTLRKKLETTCSAHVEEITKRDLQAQVSLSCFALRLLILVVCCL